MPNWIDLGTDSIEMADLDQGRITGKGNLTLKPHKPYVGPKIAMARHTGHTATKSHSTTTTKATTKTVKPKKVKHTATHSAKYLPPGVEDQTF